MVANDKEGDLTADVAISNGGMTLKFGLRFIGDKAWVLFMGQWYEASSSVTKALAMSQGKGAGMRAGLSALMSKIGVDPANWTSKPTLVGTEKINGVDAYHIKAGINFARFISDVEKMGKDPQFKKLFGSKIAKEINKDPSTVGGRKEAQRVFQGITLDLWFATGTFEDVKVTVDGHIVPPAKDVADAGFSSMIISLTNTRDQSDKPFTVTPPVGARSYKELEKVFGSSN